MDDLGVPLFLEIPLSHCWWKASCTCTSWGPVVYPIIYAGFYTSKRWLFGISSTNSNKSHPATSGSHQALNDDSTEKHMAKVAFVWPNHWGWHFLREEMKVLVIRRASYLGVASTFQTEIFFYTNLDKKSAFSFDGDLPAFKTDYWLDKNRWWKWNLYFSGVIVLNPEPLT